MGYFLSVRSLYDGCMLSMAFSVIGLDAIEVDNIGPSCPPSPE